MSKLLFCLLMAGMIASAGEAKITLKADSLRLNDLLIKMAEACPGVNLVYPNLLEFPETPADFDNVPFNEALNQVCAPYNLEVVKINQIYVLRPLIAKVVLRHGAKAAQYGAAEIGNLDQEIKLTKIDFPNRQIQFEMGGKTYTLKEGYAFGKRLELIRVVSDEEALIYYPRIIFKKHPIDE